MDTVHKTLGSKRGLLMAVMAVNVGGDDEPVAWALTSPEMHHMLLDTRGWDRAR